MPATYGGFCTLFEEVATRLAADKEISVTVYCRRSYFADRPKWIDGIRLVYLPVWKNKYLESLLFTGLSIVHSLFRGYDVIFVVDNANAPLLLPLWLLRKKTVMHTDGLGWKRRKWGKYASKYYRWTEKVAALLATELVTDARAMQDYYQKNYRAHSVFIPYGSEVGLPPDPTALNRYNLVRNGYFLVVTRIEPDNNTDLIIREYRRARLDRPLVIVGGAQYPSDFSRALEREAGPDVIFLGGIFDSAILNGIYANAYAYLHGHMVGGTNPALLRAMHAGTACIAIDVDFNREVLGDDGLYFNSDQGCLAGVLGALAGDSGDAEARGERLQTRARRLYRWDAVAAAYADLFTALVARQPRDTYYRPETFVD